jgi:hypothetical protein
MVLSHVVDGRTRAELQNEMIASGIDELKMALSGKVDEILEAHTLRHPITYDHHLIENVQKAQQQRSREALEKSLGRWKDKGGLICLSATQLVDMFQTQCQSNMELFASSTATDMMEAYYKVCAIKNH